MPIHEEEAAAVEELGGGGEGGLGETGDHLVRLALLVLVDLLLLHALRLFLAPIFFSFGFSLLELYPILAVTGGIFDFHRLVTSDLPFEVVDLAIVAHSVEVIREGHHAAKTELLDFEQLLTLTNTPNADFLSTAAGKSVVLEDLDCQDSGVVGHGSFNLFPLALYQFYPLHVRLSP